MKEYLKKNRDTKRFIGMILIVTVILLLAGTVYAAKNKATTIRLVRTEGTVTVENSSKGELTQTKDMRLNNGDHQITEKKSYAWMSLDDTKAVKLDEDSESELRKSGRKLEVLVDSGNLFFNVSVPLEKEESLNIRTSTMVTGVRGTCGWVEVSDDWVSRVYLLTGSLECVVSNPTDGKSETTMLKPGNYSDFYVYPKNGAEGSAKDGESCRVESASFGKDEIPGFVLIELLGDDKLIQKIYDESGIDLRGLTQGDVQSRLKADQDAHQTEAEKVREGGLEELTVIAKDPVWAQEGEGSPSAVVWLTMPQTAQTVQKYLDQAYVKKVILLPGDGSQEENTLKADINFTVPSAKTLEARAGVPVLVNGNGNVEILGTADLKDALTNEGKLTVKSDHTLMVAGTFENRGTFENTAKGRVILSKGMTTSGSFENAGVIEAAEGVSGDVLIRVSGGTFGMTAGMISSDRYDAIVAIDDNANAVLNLAGGVISNDKENGATMRVSSGSFQVQSLGTDVAGITDTLLGKDVNLQEYNAASVYRKDQRYHLISLDSVESYPILLNSNMINGTVVIPDRVEVGAKVTLIPVPNKGYKLESIGANYYDAAGATLGEAIALASDFSFIMPSHDVVISATFVETEEDAEAYKIKIDGVTGGSVTASAKEAKAGDEVKVRIAADAGWEFESLSIIAADQSVVGMTQSDDGYAFVMPACDVTISATFTTAECKVTFYDEDGTTVLFQTSVAYGESPVYKGVAPTKPASGDTAYEFAGWKSQGTTYEEGKKLPAAQGDVSYVATYKTTVAVVSDKYTVNWVNWDGTVLKTEKDVKSGTIPKYTGNTPTRPSDAQFTYTFSGWTSGSKTYGASEKLPAVTADVTFIATYSEKINSYTITWKNDDGTVLRTDKNVQYGTMPSYAGQTPTKAGTAQYSYTFSGWSPAIVKVTGDATYVAAYSQTIRKYTVTWKDDLGNVLGTSTVAYGDVPSFGSTPKKDQTAQYSYTFAGWKKNGNGDPIRGTLPKVDGDVSYVASFTGTVRSYTVTWKNDDGTVLQTNNNMPYGTTPSYTGQTPTKAKTAQYTYTFSGWSPAVKPVEGNVTYTATYSSTVNKYKVTWQDEDGTTLGTDSVEYGKTPSRQAPTKQSTKQYSYEFTGWSPAVTAVTKDVTYKATYKKTTREYTITWKDEDGKTLKTTTAAYGTTPSFGGTPTKAKTAQYTYTFSGWSPAIQSVEGDATYVASFTKKVNEYKITWKTDGKVLYEQQVAYGTTPSYPGATLPSKASTDHSDFVFKAWSPSVVSVTGDATYTATFTEVFYEYTVTFVGEDGGSLYSVKVEYGKSPTYKGSTPKKDSSVDKDYTFSGWKSGSTTVAKGGTFPAVTKDITYTVQFKATTRQYTYTFKDGDGKTIWTKKFDYGSTPSYGGSTPTKTKTAQYEYTFTGWALQGSEASSGWPGTVTGDRTVQAQFSSTVRKYTVTWKNYDGSVIHSEKVEYGTAPSYRTYPDRPSLKDSTGSTVVIYVLGGWKSSSGETIYGSSVFWPTVTGDITFTAFYDEYPQEVAIYFQKDDGSLITSVTALYGTQIDFPLAPEKTGTGGYYVFKGWKSISGPHAGTTYTSAPKAKGTETFQATYEWIPDI